MSQEISTELQLHDINKAACGAALKSAQAESRALKFSK